MARAYFTEEAAQRIVAATLVVEGMPTDRGAVQSRYRGDDQDPTLAISKTTADWVVGSSQELTVFEGAPPGEAAPVSPAEPRKVTAWNHHVDIPSGKWVVVGLAHSDPDGKEVWYVVSTQLSKIEVVTNIECVAGKMEVTKDFIWALPYKTQGTAPPSSGGA